MFMLLRPFRTLIILAVAFVAGLVFERSQHTDRCLDRGGAVDQGICVGVRP